MPVGVFAIKILLYCSTVVIFIAVPFEIAEFLNENNVGVFFKDKCLDIVEALYVLLVCGEHFYVIRHHLYLRIALLDLLRFREIYY